MMDGPSMTWAKMVELGTWQDAKNCSMSPLPSNRLSKQIRRHAEKRLPTGQSSCSHQILSRVLGDEVKELQEQSPTDLQSFA